MVAVVVAAGIQSQCKWSGDAVVVDTPVVVLLVLLQLLLFLVFRSVLFRWSGRVEAVLVATTTEHEHEQADETAAAALPVAPRRSNHAEDIVLL